MTFRPTLPRMRLHSGAIALVCVLAAAVAAQAGQETAVVPARTIYPGEEISIDLVREVVVTNPNLRTGYAALTSEVVGKVTTRTLLPGRTIPVGALREAWAVERGGTVPLVFNGGGLTITAVGSPLQNAAVGDFIRVRNIDSGITVSGIVMGDGSVRVAPQ